VDLYSRLMGIEEVVEYLNEKTDRDFNQDKTLKFIKEKNIPIVFEYEGWATWEFQHKSEYQSRHIQVSGYFNFRNSSEAVGIFKGFLEEMNIGEAIIYQLNSCYIRNNAPEGITPKEGDALLFTTGGRSPLFSNLNTQNTIKIDNDKVGVLKKDLEEYLNKMQIEHMDSKTKIEILESTIEQLEAEKANLKYQHTETLTAANKKIKQQEQEVNRLNDQLKEQADTSDILSDRNEKSYQTTIGLLLELMTVPKIEGDRPPFTSEAVIIGKIADKSIYGQGKTTLEMRFRDVKTTLEQTKKKAFKP